MMPLRRILHATDLSSASRPAFERATMLAKTAGAELVVAHVMTPVVPMIGDGYVSAATWATLERSVKTASRKRLEKLVAAARKAGVRARALLLDGVPPVAIVRAATSQHVDMIVMGTHGRGGLKRFFLGSVAGRVVPTAPCAVVTVRGR